MSISTALWLFIAATLLAILVSEDIRRSWRMCLPFLPALLIYFLIADRFSQSGLSMLCLCLASASLGLALALLWTAMRNPAGEPAKWIQALGSPVLIVPNDATFLAATLPFSAALMGLNVRTPFKAMGMLSIILVILTACVFKSRVALLSSMVSLAGMAIAWRPQRGLLWAGGLMMALLLLDGMLGFPFIGKHGLAWDKRISLWLAAWGMFLDSPLMGRGPRTFVLFYRDYWHNLPSWIPVDSRLTPWAHNLYLELLAEQGMIGLGSFLLLLGFAVSAGWRLFSSAQGERRIMSACSLATLAGLSMAALLELSFLRQWVCLMYMMAMGVIGFLSKQESGKRE
ncbi:MAG: O-antigen ligase family protein [Methylococcaceae bacterium]|nr:O-antigen ligase family protein [Methylococcaceae bacterium]